MAARRNTGPLLVVHWNPYGAGRRAAVQHHLEAGMRASAGSVVAVNAVGGLPSQFRLLRPRAVVLHTTFLAIRWLTAFDRWRERSAWLQDLEVPKIAIPQDDYDHADVLDEWLFGLGVTDVLTPFPSAPELYARTRTRAAIHAALTGYVDERAAARWRTAARPLPARDLDLVYRATRLPYWYGQLGQLKAEVGLKARAAAEAAGLSSDVSLDRPIVGEHWFEFLASGRVVVGCESGSSALDRSGELRRRVREILADDPGADFAAVAGRMTPGWDDHHFGALSPRHLEAAMTRTVQVLVEGTYSDVLVAGRHYVPVRPDLSDLGEAMQRALDPQLAADIAANAHADLVESGRYGYDRLSAGIRGLIPDPGRPVPRLAAVLAAVAGRSHGAAVAAAARVKRATGR